MKKHIITKGLLLLVVILAFASCGGEGKKADKTEESSVAASMEVSIGGMTCLGCEQTIQKNVGKLEGIKAVQASFTTGNAIIEYYPEKVDSLKIKDAITGSGYTVKKFIISTQQ